MPETIESFVARLESEGVQAGKQAAERLLADAQRQADEIIHAAQAHADKLLAQAQAQAENLQERARGELELAARDVVLRLQAAVSAALTAMIDQRLQEHLPNSPFVAQTLHDLVMLYAQADIAGHDRMRINVSPRLQEQLAGWALKEMTERAAGAGLAIELRGQLATAGFEYKIDGGTVEVTIDSVRELLCELIAPQLRELVRKAAGDLLPPDAAPAR